MVHLCTSWGIHHHLKGIFLLSRLFIILRVEKSIRNEHCIYYKMLLLVQWNTRQRCLFGANKTTYCFLGCLEWRVKSAGASSSAITENELFQVKTKPFSLMRSSELNDTSLQWVEHFGGKFIPCPSNIVFPGFSTPGRTILQFQRRGTLWVTKYSQVIPWS